MLTSEKPIASEQLTFTVPSDPNAAYDPSAINPTLVAEGTSATGSPISIDSEHITVTYADGTAPSADYSETFFNVLPDDSYGALTFSACTDKGNAASFTITRSTPVVANWPQPRPSSGSATKTLRHPSSWPKAATAPISGSAHRAASSRCRWISLPPPWQHCFLQSVLQNPWI